MPFGISTAPSIFQRAMDIMLVGLTGLFVNVYLDDILVASFSFEEHLTHIRKTLDQLRTSSCKLSFVKCSWVQISLFYLGHIVDTTGIRPNPKKVETILSMSAPTDKKQTKQLLGLASFYRRFIKGFSQIVFPLTSLLRKHTPFVWEEPQRRAFEALKEALTSEPVLCHPDFDKEFVVKPDASNDTIGTVLGQTDEERNERVVAYASRMMTDLEEKWGITEREALSLVYAVNTFKPYLYGKKFTVITDHKALQHIHDQKNSQPRVMRWALKLAIYEFDVQHRSGAKHADADSMTRPPVAETGASLKVPSPKRKRDRNTDSNEEDEIVVAPCSTGGAAVEVDRSDRKHELNMSTDSEVEIISVLSPGKAAVHCEGSKDRAVRPQSLHPLRVAAGKRGRPWKDNSMNSSNTKKVMKDPKPSKGWRRPTGPGRPRSGPKATPPSPSLSTPLCTGNYSIEQFKRLQKEDSTLNPVIQFLMDGSLPDDQAELSRVYSMAASHALHEGLLVRLLPPLNKHTKGFRTLTVVPRALRAEILADHHGHLCAGHGGIRSTLAKVTVKFFWPTVTADVENYVKSCETCQQRKDAFKKEHPMIVPLSTEPLTHMAVDTVGPLPTLEGKRVIISVMDLASRFVVLIAVPNQKATTIARALLDNVFFIFGSPVTLLSNQGPSFLDPIVTAVSELVGRERVCTSTYNPKANGKLERMHRELKQTLSAYIAEYQKDWVRYLPVAAFLHNATRHAALGISPFEFLFGFPPRTPTKLSTDLQESTDIIPQDYVKVLSEIREENKKTARDIYMEAAEQRVWARVKRTKKGYAAKLTTKYEGPFRVLEVRDNRTLLLKQPGAQTRRVINRDNAKPFVHRELKENDALLSWFMPELEEDGKQADPIDNDEFGEYEVEKIYAKRRTRRGTEFLVKNKGYTEKEWTPEEELDCADKVEEFHARLRGGQ
uniref:Integrase catalytic domain-containing protein n=1 Tax=Chromera velia CCMP2878 TaxID=1169474 RepID=A0A0G4I6I2_9ALVE|eukprot:Cvel_11420.t1-p1 / transcript=Cvel_11420.t1 / gene=Cvel_11420 / organism=Chromera_velia_CCMP2878 / gene_product=Retrovirus-related Pol polyprotein from transposon, putative / transcript_product=Retrovirus-related Pol polyprotein from transposon, putative / location=Cvel_scaffold718:222-3125(-) / protein_length=944 / sequence_SO=supercontig / SO=protein_coding / is_pseudo=false